MDFTGGSGSSDWYRDELAHALYQEQWTKLLDMADQIRAFIAEHKSELKKKE